MTMPPVPKEGNPAELLTVIASLREELAHCTHLLASVVYMSGGKIVISEENVRGQGNALLHIQTDVAARQIVMELEDPR